MLLLHEIVSRATGLVSFKLWINRSEEPEVKRFLDINLTILGQIAIRLETSIHFQSHSQNIVDPIDPSSALMALRQGSNHPLFKGLSNPRPTIPSMTLFQSFPGLLPI